MAKDHVVLRRQDLIQNPTPRVPICLVLDCSPSMAEAQGDESTPIDALNEGVRQFFDEIKNDEIAGYAAEIAIVAFSGVAQQVLDFGPIRNVSAPVLEIERQYGGTSIGGGVRLGMKLLDARKQEYKDAGVDYFQPWLVLMTDGEPTDDLHKEVAPDVAEKVRQKRLTVFPIGVGNAANLEVLALFSPKNGPIRLKGLMFKEFFQWLSKSVSATSQSSPGENVPLDKDGIKGWGDL